MGAASRKVRAPVSGFIYMASPQLENGYTQIANEILERLSLPGISGSEFRLVLIVIRKTYGYQKKKDRISLTQFEKFSGMKRSHVVRTLKELVHKRVLLHEKNLYSLNKNWEQWVVSKRVPPVHNSGTPSTQKGTKSSTQLGTHKRKKENNTKETIQASQDDARIPVIINLFKEVNPSYQRLFSVPPQREAVKRLLAVHGMEKLTAMIQYLPKSNAARFAPTITTPVQFEAKLGELVAWSQKQKQPLRESNVAFI